MSESLTDEQIAEMVRDADDTDKAFGKGAYVGEKSAVRHASQIHALAAECRRRGEELIKRNHLIAELTETGLDIALDERDAARAEVEREVRLRQATETALMQISERERAARAALKTACELLRTGTTVDDSAEWWRRVDAFLAEQERK